MDASLAESTKRAYRSGWQRWVMWSAHRHLPPLPVDPEELARFLADAADQSRSGRPRWKVGTLDMWVNAIAYTATGHGYPNPATHPVVRATRDGIRRRVGVRPERKQPVTVAQIGEAIAAMAFDQWPAGVAAARDAALLLCGIAGVGRRSELAGLNMSDLSVVEGGLNVLVRRSKTDQHGEGMVKFLPVGSQVNTCVPCALWWWIDMVCAADEFTARRSALDGGRDSTQLAHVRALTDATETHHAAMIARVLGADRTEHVCGRTWPALGDVPLFRPVNRTGTITTPDTPAGTGRTSAERRDWKDRARLSGHGVNLIVQRRLGAIGLVGAKWASHSLRTGFVTEALRAGATTRQVARQTGQSENTVAIYDREHTPSRDNAVNTIGL